MGARSGIVAHPNSLSILVVAYPHLAEHILKSMKENLLLLVVLGTEPRTSCMPGKHATAEPRPLAPSLFLVRQRGTKFPRLSPPVRPAFAIPLL